MKMGQWLELEIKTNRKYCKRKGWLGKRRNGTQGLEKRDNEDGKN